MPSIRKVPICPVVTYDFLDDPPDEGGTDPFVVGDLTTGSLANFVKAKVYARVCQNPVDDDTPASKSVDAHQTWVIDVYWRLTGPLVSAFCGNWDITIYFESMGPDDYDFEIVTPGNCLIGYGCPQPPNTDRNTRIYHASYRVPADTVQTEPNGTPYELNLGLVLFSQCDQRPLELVGFVSLEDIFFF
jgi:hypothetical protein